MIAAGRLLDEVTLNGPASRVDGAGQAITSSRPIFTVPAEVKQETAQEASADGRTITRVKYRVTIRFIDDADITPEWEVEYAGRTLAISAVQDTQRREELIITATETR
jgi:SPP1 family predicted phage head-tail adaptor